MSNTYYSNRDAWKERELSAFGGGLGYGGTEYAASAISPWQTWQQDVQRETYDLPPPQTASLEMKSEAAHDVSAASVNKIGTFATRHGDVDYVNVCGAKTVRTSAGLGTEVY